MHTNCGVRDVKTKHLTPACNILQSFNCMVTIFQHTRHFINVSIKSEEGDNKGSNI